MIKLVPPLHEDYPITQPFGVNPDSYAQFGLPGHNGIDYGCPLDTAVYSAFDGVVMRVEYDKDGYGNFIKIKHDGYTTLYGHLSQPMVQVNDKVVRGQFIGRSGSTGNSTGPHLHFELRIIGQENNGYYGAVDPQPYLDGAVESSGNSGEVVPGDTVMVTAGDGLRVRSEPNVTCKFYGYASPGDQFQVMEVVQEGERKWAQVYAYICLEDGNDVYAVKG